MKSYVKLWMLVFVVGLVVALAPTTQSQEVVVCENDVVVQAEDWLSKIADKTLGNVLAYPAIFKATNEKAAVDNTYATIADPNLIEPGWKLCIPSAEYAAGVLDEAGQPAATTETGTGTTPEAGGTTEAAVPAGALVSNLVTTAPTLDGVGNEAFWTEATAITIKVDHGVNTEETEVMLKSVYDGKNVYFLMTWADPTESFIRSPWEKQADGSWKKLKDPNDKGGDNNVYYEDKMAFIWPINNSIPKFETQGCMTACHAGENEEAKPYGNKLTDSPDQMGDIWHWKSVRNLNQIDDQYLDSVAYSKDTPEAGRHSDPKDSGGYVDNQTEDKTMPMWMGPAGSPVDGSPGYILDAEKVAFDDKAFAAGDRVAGILKSVITGDRGNISAGWKYANGMWTLEFGRALETGSQYDVQFSDLTAVYHFAVATFDNAQVRHAYQKGAETLVFKQ